jgi:hypothetical protein
VSRKGNIGGYPNTYTRYTKIPMITMKVALYLNGDVKKCLSCFAFSSAFLIFSFLYHLPSFIKRPPSALKGSIRFISYMKLSYHSFFSERKTKTYIKFILHPYFHLFLDISTTNPNQHITNTAINIYLHHGGPNFFSIRVRV